MANSLYNKSFIVDANSIDLIIDFFKNYKLHLRNKEYTIYKKNIPRLMEFMGAIEQNIITELNNFQKNDSDNEENYSAEYKNCEDEDSVSEYNTDTDDENTNNLRKKLVVKSSAIKKSYELNNFHLPVKFKKIK